MTCKHNWHFVHGTSTLKCERCGAETGPTPPEQLARALVPDLIHHTDTSETLEYITGWNDCRQAVLSQQALNKMAENARELGLDYEPAQRIWVSLTDEEIQTTWNSVMRGDVFTRRDVYKAIEAKLREKST